jgi:FtsZ-interacting cell division protein YlmF
MEDKQWKWEEPEEKQESSTEKQESSTWEIINDNIDYESVRGTRLLSEIYESSNIAICEPAEFEEAMKNNEWIEAIKEKLRMIKKKMIYGCWWTNVHIKRS